MSEKNIKKAVFGAGCFWGVEQGFLEKLGVVDTAVGFMGGHVKNPGYREVCTGKTGHAEVVLVEYDPEQISYEQLLDEFWELHDPTTLDRQGPDVGSQYRSVIFYFDDQQREAAEESKKRKQEKFEREIVTAIEPAGEFWRAEEYHQHYFEKHGLRGCGF